MKEVNYDFEKNKLDRVVDALCSIDTWHYRRVAIMQSNEDFLENGGK